MQNKKMDSNPESIIIGSLIALSLGHFVPLVIPVLLIAAVVVLLNYKKRESLSLELTDKEFFSIALYSVAFQLASYTGIKALTTAGLILSFPFLAFGYISGMLASVAIQSKIGYSVGLVIGIYVQVYLIYVFYRHKKMSAPNKSLKDAP